MNFETGFDDYYIIGKDIELSELTLQESEVQAVKFADKDEILSMIDSGIFIPYHKSLIAMIFDMKDKSGAHS